MAQRHGSGFAAVLDLTPNQILGIAAVAAPPRTFTNKAEALAYAAQRRARLLPAPGNAP